ncbi:aminopeptidase T. Metallo peptidase. MEROPS family M29 [Salinihabitans flavidus]|uniref:Aminopeptidase T. Metallo peptidase. MEROPS family M29 n=1 Tax=Salinihabitans flavidus TaxID=569882 RepID=A0A1H8RC94_9RHOB|nr:aminopeptidase [Salinihabitans flavidus]SEO63986.1 aminopeptidase T. Metallo peptidase. MEROPS family M29 [Salinihabitans flavidus]
MTQPSIDPQHLDRLAETAVRVGLNLQPGQDLVLTAPTSALPLVRRVVAAAYRAGAGLVTPLLSDEEVTLARYQNAPDQSFDRAPDWLYDGMARAFGDGAARMAIVGDDPMLLAQEDPAHVSRAGKANSAAYRPALEKIANFDINWTIAAYPGASWARRVFPDLPEEEAVARLAKAIFAASRVDLDDPVAAWTAHNEALHLRKAWLNEQAFAALHFTGPGTDLTVGLADDHEWQGGASLANNGVICNPNIPSEEVFTTPHAERVEGTARASKPLSHQGSLIDGIEVTFEGGRITQARASRGEAVLHELLDTDEGARRLGEVALVPHSSPISQSGLLFYNTLFDENAACHIALGQCYAKCFRDGETLGVDEIAERGGNASMIHVDWMIGGPETDIDGITPGGTRVPVFRAGEWAR